MDPFEDLFSFIHNNDLNEGQQIHNIETRRPSLSKNNEKGDTKTSGKYVCDKCEYTTDKRWNMNLHNDSVHLKITRYKCSVCDYARYQRPEITAHIKSKHRNEQCRPLTIGCRLCERKEKHECCVKQQNTFGKNKTVVKLIKSHNQNGKLKCKECEYTSNQEQAITRHNEAVHMDIKKYFCRSCKYQSYYKKNMKAHTVNNHKSALNKFGKIGCESCENTDNLEGCNICDLKEN